jgi:hypothetical protein
MEAPMGVVEAVIRALLYLCAIALVFYLVLYVLAALGVALPAMVVTILKVMFVLVAILILVRLFWPLVAGCQLVPASMRFEANTVLFVVTSTALVALATVVRPITGPGTGRNGHSPVQNQPLQINLGYWSPLASEYKGTIRLASPIPRQKNVVRNH